MDKCLEIGVNFFDTAEVRADDLFIKIPHDILFEQTEDDRNIWENPNNVTITSLRKVLSMCKCSVSSLLCINFYTAKIVLLKITI